MTDSVLIRWLIRRDYPAVLDIERKSFEFIWTEEDFLCCLRQRNCIGMVTEIRGEVVGFMIYELYKDQLRILNFAVDPAFRRQWIGSRMVSRLKDKLSQQRRKRLVLDVRETNLGAQKFFQSQGFKAVSILRGYYEETGEDAYHMRYSLTTEDDVFSPFHPRNRITQEVVE